MNNIGDRKILFLDIDGVLTATDKYIPNTSSIITNGSIRVLREAQKKGFITVFITARSVRELKLKDGFESTLRKNKLNKKSLIYGAFGLDQASSSFEFKIKNGKIIYKNGNAVLEKKLIIKRETFSNIDAYLLYKMLLGKEIKQQLKYAGFKIKPAIAEEIVSDARILFELEDNSNTNRKKAVNALKNIVKEQYKAFCRTKKFGSPVVLTVYDIRTAISIEPIELGKHLGVLRALNTLGIKPHDKIIAYAFGDKKHDSQMKIRRDIEFTLVEDNKDFVKKLGELLKHF